MLCQNKILTGCRLKLNLNLLVFLSGDYIPKEYFMTEGYSYEDSVWFVDDILLALLEKDSISDIEKRKAGKDM